MTQTQIEQAANNVFQPILRDMISRGRARDLAVQMVKDLQAPTFAADPSLETFKKAAAWDKLAEIIKHYDGDLISLGYTLDHYMAFVGHDSLIRSENIEDLINTAHKTII